jgi:hypothetical protein
MAQIDPKRTISGVVFRSEADVSAGARQSNRVELLRLAAFQSAQCDNLALSETPYRSMLANTPALWRIPVE